MTRRLLPAVFLLVMPLAPAHAQSRRPLSASDVDDIAQLEILEDRRQFDSTELTRLLTSSHPEVRRRAALATGRINDKRGIALLLARPLDADTAVAATEVFAVGHLRDASTVAWFDSLLSSPGTPPTVLAEAACALGKIQTPAAREVLVRFLDHNPANPRTTAAIQEALLSVGRSPRGDIAPILRWTTSGDEEIRWRATWALFRPRDPASVAPLLVLAKDKSPLVRSWALRGLSKPEADSAQLGAEAEALLLGEATDNDRRVATEALNALGSYSDSTAVAALMKALQSPDSWLAVSGATGLGRAKAAWSVPALVAATSSNRPCDVRVVAMQSLEQVARDTVAHVAADIAQDTVPYCKRTATTTIARLNAPSQGRGGRGGGPRTRPPVPERPIEDYKAVVERWVVPAYNGAAPPVVRFETVRGAIDIELYPGEAPLAVDDLMKTLQAGTIAGTEFTRVVPDFVDQQQTIPGGHTLRDEVNRHRLTRANLSWATGGLDTGTPGYTLNHTPQPHNEGNFTSMGRVIRGMDVVDRIELGDRVLGGRILAPAGR